MTSMTNIASSTASMYQYPTYSASLHSSSEQMPDRYTNTSLLPSVVLSPAQQDRRTSSEEHEDQKPSASPSCEALALEKKRKNATAQAAFRARRSNYIANLEETVISLENVVRRLQDACRDSQEDMATLREENLRLKGLVDGFKQREGIWKAYAKVTAGVPVHPGDVQPHSAHNGFTDTPESSSGSLPEGGSNPQLAYTNDTGFYPDSSAYPFQHGRDVDHDYNGFSSSSMHMYSNGLEVDSSSSTSSGSKLSPTSSIPPTPTSAVLDVTYGTQSMGLFSGTGSKGSYSSVGGNYNMDTAAIQSPDFSTYHLSSSLNLSTGVGSHRRTLSGPVADASSMDLTLYTTEDRNSSNSACSPSSLSTRASTRARRNTHAAFPSPLSPPPRASAKLLKSTSVASAASAASGISNTLAVIKAQAFGNVRKTRARAKKAGNGNPREAAKAALEVLEVRGLGLGLDVAGGVKRRRRGEYGAEQSDDEGQDHDGSS